MHLLLNRIDDIVIFQPLTREQIATIVELQMARVRRRLEQRGITVELTKAAADFLATAGFDPSYGARPLKRVIQQHILDELSLRIVEGTIADGDTVVIDASEGGLAMKKKRKKV